MTRFPQYGILKASKPAIHWDGVEGMEEPNTSDQQRIELSSGYVSVPWIEGAFWHDQFVTLRASILWKIGADDSVKLLDQYDNQ